MDGNGRWAARRDLPRRAGHQQGVANIRRVVRALAERGVSVVTLYAFSTENWRRPTEEVDGLLTILAEEIEPQPGNCTRPACGWCIWATPSHWTRLCRTPSTRPSRLPGTTPALC